LSGGKEEKKGRKREREEGRRRGVKGREAIEKTPQL